MPQRDEPDATLAGVMKTEARLAALANGYTPLPNEDKQCFLEGWPTVQPTPDLIEGRWARMGFEATGIRIEPPLMVLDFDIEHGAVENLYEHLTAKMPVLAGALMRIGKAPKEAWFLRVDEPFARIATPSFYDPTTHDPEDDDARLVLEVFGGGSPRQFGALGWHTKGKRTYEWVDGDNPTNTPLADLPEITKDDVFEIVRLTSEWMTAQGWEVLSTRGSGEVNPEQVYDLTPEMEFVTNHGDTLSLDDLRAALDGDRGWRCSASFLGERARNRTRVMLSLDQHGGVAAFDTETSVTHHEAARARDVDATRAKVAAKMTENAMLAPPGSGDTLVDRMARERIVGSTDYLTTESSGNLKKCPYNVAVWLTLKGFDDRIFANTFAKEVWVMDDLDGILSASPGPYPRPWNHGSDLRALSDAFVEDMQFRLGVPFSETDIMGGVARIADRTPIDPIIDWECLKGPGWDGVPRLSTWLTDYAGVVPDAVHSRRYIEAVARKWMISVVARGYIPGTKADHVLVLVGAQGDERAGKTSLFTTLAGSYSAHHEGRLFREGMPSIGGKGGNSADLKQWMHGVLIAEVAELASFSSADENAVKSFLTQTHDKFRAPYAGGPESHLRRTVLFATTNDRQFLPDVTGNRRFWPVPADGVVDMPGLREVRDQLWAEAVAAYEAGEPWWFDVDNRPEDALALKDAKIAQAAARIVDPNEVPVRRALRFMPDGQTSNSVYEAVFASGARDRLIPAKMKHDLDRWIRLAGWVSGPIVEDVPTYVRGPKAEPLRDRVTAENIASGAVRRFVETDEDRLVKLVAAALETVEEGGGTSPKKVGGTLRETGGAPFADLSDRAFSMKVAAIMHDLGWAQTRKVNGERLYEKVK